MTSRCASHQTGSGDATGRADTGGGSGRVSAMRAKATASAFRSPETTASTSPISSARGAATGRPEVTSSTATATPARRGVRTVPDAPGTIPRLTSGSPTKALSSATRNRQPIATSNPPPRAEPWIAATQGLTAPSSLSTRSGRCGGTGGFPNSDTSAPAMKVRPAQISTTARTEGSASRAATDSQRPWRRAWLRAFTGGLSTVTTAIPSACSTLTILISPPSAGLRPF